MAHAPRGEDMTPPRDNWERPPEVMGYVPVEDFKPPGDLGTPVAMLRMALRKVNMEAEAAKLVQALKGGRMAWRRFGCARHLRGG